MKSHAAAQRAVEAMVEAYMAEEAVGAPRPPAAEIITAEYTELVEAYTELVEAAVSARALLIQRGLGNTFTCTALACALAKVKGA